MKKYILISETLDTVQTVEGFFDTVEEAKEYAEEEGMDIIHIYELVDNSFDLA